MSVTKSAFWFRSLESSHLSVFLSMEMLFRETNWLFWWSWRDIPPSGRLEDTREELCRPNELETSEMHKEPETWRPLSAHFLHPSARLQLGNPAWKKQSSWNRSRRMSRRVGCPQRTYVSTEHVVCAANFDSVEPNWWYRVNAIKNQKNLFFGSFGAEQRVEIKLRIIKETRRF